MSAGAMTIGDLAVKLGLDPDLASFAAGTSALERLWQGLATLAVKAQQAGKALVGFVVDTANYADSIDEAAMKSGVGAEALQELAYAASFSGMDLQSMTLSLGFLNKAMVASRTGSKDLKKLFRDLGVSVTDGNKGFLSAQDVLEQLADRFAEMPDGAEKYDAAIKLFGKSGGAMIPFLNAGASGIGKLREEAKRLGVVLGEDQVKAGAAASDTVDNLKWAWVGLKRTIGAELFPALASATTALTSWIVANRKAIASGLVSFLHAIAAAFRVVWIVASNVARVVGFVARNLKTLGIVIGSILIALLVHYRAELAAIIAKHIVLGAVAMAEALKMAAAWVIALGPIALLAAAAIAAVALIIKYWGHVKDAAAAVASFIKGIFTGIFDWIERQVNRLANAAKAVSNFLNPSAAAFAEWAGPEAVAAARSIGVPGVAPLPGASSPTTGIFGAPRAPVSNSTAKSVNVNSTNNVAVNIAGVPASMTPAERAEFGQSIAAEVQRQIDTAVLHAAAGAD